MPKWSLWLAALVIVAGGAFALGALRKAGPAPISSSVIATEPSPTVTLPAPAAGPTGATKPAAPDKAATAPVTSTPAPTSPEATKSPASATVSPTGQAPRHFSAMGQPGAQGGPGQGRHRPPSFALMRMFRGIGRLEEDGKTPLTPQQAKAILAVMTPLRTKATLTPEEAEKARTQLDAQLTQAQRDAIAQAAQNRGGWGGGQRGGFGGGQAGGPGGQAGAPGGAPSSVPGPWQGRVGGGQTGGPGGQAGAPGGAPGGPGGGRGMGAPMDPNMNPFNPSGNNPMAGRMAERNKAIFDALEAKAKK